MSEPLEFFGYAAACLTTFSFVPQVIQTIKTKDTKSISLLMYLMFWLGILLWLTYGLIFTLWPIIVANAITLLLSGVVLIMKLRNYSGDKANNAGKSRSFDKE